MTNDNDVKNEKDQVIQSKNNQHLPTSWLNGVCFYYPKLLSKSMNGLLASSENKINKMLSKNCFHI